MPIIALLGLIPGLVSAAESIFGGGKGEEKHGLVRSACEVLFDKALVKVMPDIPCVNERRLFLAIVDAVIVEVVQSKKESNG